MNDIEALRLRKATLAAAIAAHVYEPPEAAELRRTEAALREAEHAEQAAAERERARRVAVIEPELERAKARTMIAIHAFAAAFEAERTVRERAHDAGLGDLGPWSIGPFLAGPLLRIADEHKENRA